MAQRRLFSLLIVDSDAFLDMPASSQLLYFHLAMRADDDGFVNPRKIMRMTAAGSDDLKVLLTKRFVLTFESGVVVIKHWLIHNTIRQDRYKETLYLDEKKLIKVKENGAYTDMLSNGLPNGNQVVPQVKLSKDKISKDNTPSGEGKEVNEIIFLFKEVNPLIERCYGRTSERKAVERMLKEFGREKLEDMIKSLPALNGQKYWPKSTTPIQLENNVAIYQAKKSELETKQAERKIKPVLLK